MRPLTFFCALLTQTFIYCYGTETGQTLSGLNTETNWTLIFQDDFNGTVVDPLNWSMYDSPGHAGNGLRKPSAFSVQDGMLVVTALMLDGKLVSGGMAHKTNYTYGKFEFRVKTETDVSSATSGVVLTWPKSERWPVDGENDIYETGTGSTRGSFHTFIHYGADNSQFHFEHKVDASEWHIVAMVWTKDSMDIYRDGQMVYKLTDTNAIPKVAHHLCIQLDAFKPTMTGTVRMFVDWVKIYHPGTVSEIYSLDLSNNVSIFPNPVLNYFDIKSPDIQTLKSYSIYSVVGKIIKSDIKEMSQINCSHLKKGIYFLKANFKNKSEIVRFVKL